MVKWFHTYCLMKQLCDTPLCPDYKEKNHPKDCSNCDNFFITSDFMGHSNDYDCKIHEFPDDTEVFPCGCFCKDYTPKKLE